MDKKSVIVLGGGSAGWMAAGYFSVKGFDVTLIQSPLVGIIGVGESTIPAMNWFAQELGMDEPDWMPSCNATFKIGIRHSDWKYKGSDWWHLFLYDRQKEPQQMLHVHNYTLPPKEDLEYGYHVDAHTFGETLCQKVALLNGCKKVYAHIQEVEADESGIKTLVAADGKRYNADYYIDCSGWRKLLAERLELKYRPYNFLLQDRAVAGPQPSLERIDNWTTTKARSNGWIWEIPLTHRRGTGYVYSSQNLSEDEAIEEYLQEYPNTNPSKLQKIRFKPEVCETPIYKNLAVVGLAGGFIEPLEATSLFLTQFMIRQAYRVWGEGRRPEVVNRNQRRVFDHIATFVLCHYTLSNRQDNEFWQHYYDVGIKEKHREMVLENSAHPDIGKWTETNLFFPYNWWSMGKAYDLDV
jgi:hypothetical protein